MRVSVVSSRGWLAVMMALVLLAGCPNDEDEETPDGTTFVFVGADGEATGGKDGAGGADAGDPTDVVDPGDSAGAEDDANEAEDVGSTGDAGSQPPPFNYPCTPGAVEACVTACESAGKRLCLKEWGPCVPPDEFCGNCQDDDCDGAVDEGCPPNPDCTPVVEDCPTAVITIQEGTVVGTGTTLHLSAASSLPAGTVDAWKWSVQTPAGAVGSFAASDDVEAPEFAIDVAGTYLFTLVVWVDGVESCSPAQVAVVVNPVPPLGPEVGCADGEREGFLDLDAYTHIAGCSGAWDQPGITPDGLVQTCGGQGGDDGAKADGAGCASLDLCAAGWHICVGWQEVAAKSTTGCVGATPPDAKPKSLLFAVRQPSENGSVCGDWGDGLNDVFGCGNLGNGLGPDKGCGPLDRVLASTQADSCGFNEAEPNLGPWECIGGPGSDLLEGQTVTKKGCPGASCSYDGYPVSSSDKGGVLCCRD